ncbi:MAG: formylglycine-generating enzyme family protein, partial [Treponema sp.]|nr:formylglycine-generating enzyme family protein [Treponema sp.]
KENITKLEMANIQYIVTGSVNAIGGAYAVTVKILDVSSGQFSHSADEFMEGNPQDIYNGVSALVSRFIAGMGSETGRVVQQPSAPAQRPVPADMVRIAGGTFMMGSPASKAGRDDDETRHSVSISGPFYIGKHEVTQKEWEEVMGTNPSYFKGDNLPVESVSWYEAVEYCNKRSEREGLTLAYTIDKTRSNGNNLDGNDNVKWVVTWNRSANGYRLPTEAEWELACRAGTSTAYSTGAGISTSQARYGGSYSGSGERDKTIAVGSFAPNAWGLYDMHGNVWEWCWDWYGSYGSGFQTDPAGASSVSFRVFRGGGWSNTVRYVRSAGRSYYTPSTRNNILGFRVLRPQM